MTKFIFKVLLLTILVSCNKDPGQDNCSTSTDGPTVSSLDSSTPTSAGEGCSTNGNPDNTDGGVVVVPPADSGDVPGEALIFGANIFYENFDKTSQSKVEKAIEIIKKVVASAEFKNRILNFTYNGKKQFVDNNGLTNEQIYQKILEGAEDLRPEVDHEMDLELELYYSWTSTVGYTYPDELRIYMNTKFFNSYTAVEVADNVFHEWTHKLGFDHDASYSVSRDSSVPYALGYLIEELGAKYQ